MEPDLFRKQWAPRKGCGVRVLFLPPRQRYLLVLLDSQTPDYEPGCCRFDSCRGDPYLRPDGFRLEPPKLAVFTGSTPGEGAITDFDRPSRTCLQANLSSKTGITKPFEPASFLPGSRARRVGDPPSCTNNSGDRKTQYCGVEEENLARLITWRSQCDSGRRYR
jgi:hypothetical protein